MRKSKVSVFFRHTRIIFTITYTYINYSSKTITYSTYNTSITYTTLQYLSNAYMLHITQKLHYSQHSSKNIV